MHTFQPYPTDLLELNPFSKIGKEWMLVTAGTKEKANTMTASWGGLGVMWGKNVAYVFVRESRYTKEFIDANDTFSLTFLQGQQAALKYLGTVSGRDEDKISGARMNVNYHDNTPFIDEGNLVLICRKLSSTVLSPDQFVDETISGSFYKDGDLHTMYTAEITQILAR